MKKQPAKVEEPRTSYVAKKPAKAVALKPSEPESRRPEDAAFKMAADKIFSERKELLRKLAQ